MTRSEMIRAGALYFPLVLSCIAGLLWGTRRPRVFPACLLSLLWTAPALLLLQQLNASTGWWSFADGSVWFSGMPLELYIGWLIGWGILPQLTLLRLPLGFSIATMVALDVLVMPLCHPVLVLGPRWLVGEAAAAAIVLAPALCIARWTQQNMHLRFRVWLQIVTSAGVFLYLLPEIAFAARPGRGWEPLLAMPGWERQIALQLIAVLALPGVGAVMEFAERGDGTPIPFDPPVRLVTSGIYRYCANPMAASCAVVLLAWAALLRNGWLLLTPVVSVIYSAGIAEWDEGEDMQRRFGEAWRTYREAVQNWMPRWRPYHAGDPVRLYLAASCGPCSELWQWIAARNPVGLEILPAESLPYGSIRRMRYVPGDATASVDGVRAMGRALEHLNLGWAVAGIALRLPLAWQFVQVMMDASGLGPRIPAAALSCPASESTER
jgi:protein-S-isoprenylcysteine O-methyltransferase Ste14